MRVILTSFWKRSRTRADFFVSLLLFCYIRLYPIFWQLRGSTNIIITRFFKTTVFFFLVFYRWRFYSHNNNKICWDFSVFVLFCKWGLYSHNNYFFKTTLLFFFGYFTDEGSTHLILRAIAGNGESVRDVWLNNASSPDIDGDFLPGYVSHLDCYHQYLEKLIYWSM